MRKPTQKDYEDQVNLNIELTAESLPWDPSSHEYSRQEQNMLDYKGGLTIPTPGRGQLFINFFILHAYDVINFINDDHDCFTRYKSIPAPNQYFC